MRHSGRIPEDVTLLKNKWESCIRCFLKNIISIQVCGTESTTSEGEFLSNEGFDSSLRALFCKILQGVDLESPLVVSESKKEHISEKVFN